MPIDGVRQSFFTTFFLIIISLQLTQHLPICVVDRQVQLGLGDVDSWPTNAAYRLCGHLASNRWVIPVPTVASYPDSSGIQFSCFKDLHACGTNRRGSRIFERGGVQARIQDFSQAPPPLDIVRVTSSDLRKFEKHPTLGHSQAPPPLGHCPRDVIRPQKI